MAARIIYLGTDTCYRLPVLVRAGYQVESYASTDSLREAMHALARVDAILLTDRDGAEPEEALALARANGLVPVILFRDHNWDGAVGEFDLVVPPLTPPRYWLEQIEFLIRANPRGSRRGPIECNAFSTPQTGRGQGIA